MDGPISEHPPEYRPHTWMGFVHWQMGKATFSRFTPLISSRVGARPQWLTGERQGYLVDTSFVTRDHLTHVSIGTDHVYPRPLLSPGFILNQRLNGKWLWPCEYVVDVHAREGGRAKLFPGANS